jgi:hypothetical protein
VFVKAVTGQPGVFFHGFYSYTWNLDAEKGVESNQLFKMRRGSKLPVLCDLPTEPVFMTPEPCRTPEGFRPATADVLKIADEFKLSAHLDLTSSRGVASACAFPGYKGKRSIILVEKLQSGPMMLCRGEPGAESTRSFTREDPKLDLLGFGSSFQRVMMADQGEDAKESVEQYYTVCEAKWARKGKPLSCGITAEVDGIKQSGAARLAKRLPLEANDIVELKSQGHHSPYKLNAKVCVQTQLSGGNMVRSSHRLNEEKELAPGYFTVKEHDVDKALSENPALRAEVELAYDNMTTLFEWFKFNGEHGARYEIRFDRKHKAIAPPLKFESELKGESKLKAAETRNKTEDKAH